MPARILLARHLRDVLGVSAVLVTATACDELPQVFQPELDDEACLTVALDDECPSSQEAADQLIGSETCEDPVREIIAIGDFIERREVDSQYWYDTGWTANYESCCYEAAYDVKRGEGCAIGRPLVVGAETHLAPPVRRTQWSRGERPDASALSDAARADLASFWAHVGLMEHASVASFARFSLQLIAQGAPPALLLAAHEAASDEVRHAEACLALASTYGADAVGPGELPAVLGVETQDLIALAVATASEACIGETLSVVLAAEQLRGATDPAVRRVLSRILRDETRHAALGWDTLRWVLARCPDARDPVARIFANASEHLPSLHPFARGSAATRGHGLPAPEGLERALEDGLARVVLPAARQLLSG